MLITRIRDRARAWAISSRVEEVTNVTRAVPGDHDHVTHSHLRQRVEGPREQRASPHWKQRFRRMERLWAESHSRPRRQHHTCQHAPCQRIAHLLSNLRQPVKDSPRIERVGRQWITRLRTDKTWSLTWSRV